MNARSVTRSIPPSIAPVVELLELDRQLVLTTGELHDLVEQAGVDTPGHVVIQRLQERGWLSPTGVRGTWEFIPGEQAGPYPQGDPLLVLRASLAKDPRLPASVALVSALWKMGLADRAPEPHEIAFPSNERVPVAVERSFRVVRFEPNLQPAMVDDLPTHDPATVLVHSAHRPSDVRGWGLVLDGLAELVDRCSLTDVTAELEGRPHATRVRLAYLLSGVAPETVSSLEVQPAGKVWFGPRRKLRRHNAHWNVADTILPFSPTDLRSRR